MKPDTRVLEAVSTVEGKVIEMSMDEDSTPFLMSMLTDVYSDPEMAVIREYATNGRDSQLEAGVDRPIEITLPGPLAMSLKIRDFGTGLDAQEIEEIYSKYGRSTKRDSNDAVGVLGIGCKSGLTYTDSFTLSGIKDGIRTEVIVTRNALGGGSMTIPITYPTDEENGVEVVIPAKSYNRFEQKAAELFRFWPEGSVLVDGKAPERIDGIWISEDMVLVDRNEGLDSLTVVMGGIPYPADGRHRSNKDLVVFVEIGEVSFAPSREALYMNKKTQDKIDEILLREEERTKATLADMVNACTTPHEAARMANRLAHIGPVDRTWNGQEIPAKFKGEFTEVPLFKDRWNKAFIESDEYPVGVTSLWFTGYDLPKLTPNRSKKLRQWYAKQDIDPAPREFVLVKDLPDGSEWIDPARTFDWAIIEAEKLERRKRDPNDPSKTLTNEKQKFAGWKPGRHYGSSSRHIDPSEVATSKLFYFQGYSNEAERTNSHVNLLRTIVKEPTVVVVPSNRIKRFKEENPKAKEIRDYIRAVANRWAAKLTETHIRALSMNGTAKFLAKMDPEQIEDPELVANIEAARSIDPIRKRINLFGGWIQLPDVEELDPIADYPLLEQFNSYYGMQWHDDLYIYINAAYAERKGN